MIKKETIKVYDMTCTSCEKRIEISLRKIPGVINAIANFSDEKVTVEYDTELCNIPQIKEAIKKAGYSTQSSSNFKLVGMFIIFAAVLLLGTSTSGFDMNEKLNGASYFVLFIVGALTSIHCVGMCGGIMLSQSISKESTSKLKALSPAILYNAGRVVSYTIVGALVGAVGSVLSLSIKVNAALQIFAGVFMIIMGLNMAGYSIFKKFNIKLPWSACSVKNKPKTPFLVGMLNGLMPCGPLQTMQLYALGTGSALKGALSMFVFSLGTIPLMLTFGVLSGLLSKGYTKQILKFSGILVVVLGLIMGNRGLALAGVGMPNLTSMVASANGSTNSANIAKATIENGVQIINMTADNRGYTPNVFYVQKGVPVKWIINGKQLNSCNNAIIASAIDNKQHKLSSGENVIEFTPKDKDINFSCWMGMIRGVIKVTDSLDSVDTSKPDDSLPPPSSGGSCCSPSGSTLPPSIYGDDLSKVATDVLIRKATINNNQQSFKTRGLGYEFEPLIIVANKGIKLNLSIDLTKFDTPDGKFEIISEASQKTVTTIEGKKGTIVSELFSDKTDVYWIVKDNMVLGAINFVEDINSANLEEIRKDFFLY